MPGIVSDIDGVLYKGNIVLGNSTNVVKSLLKPFGEKNQTLPFMLVTNNGGLFEADKAININSKIHLDKEDDQELTLAEKHIIECHTPLSDPEVVKRYEDKYVLVSGYFDCLAVAISYGYKKAIDIEELVALYPDSMPLDVHK